MSSEKQDKKDEDGCWDCLQIMSMGILFTGLVAAGICYLVFGIKFLVDDYSIADDCSGSDLWAYVLVIIITTTPLFLH